MDVERERDGEQHFLHKPAMIEQPASFPARLTDSESGKAIGSAKDSYAVRSPSVETDTETGSER